MQYLKGEKNKVADGLSHYYANDRPDEKHDVSMYINANVRLDLEGEDLTIARTAELFTFKANMPLGANVQEQVRDHVEPRAIEAERLSTNKEDMTDKLPAIDLSNRAIRDIFNTMAMAYKEDRFFSKIWKDPGCYDKFTLNKGLLWTKNRADNKVVCVPNGLVDGKAIRGAIIDLCHQTTGHSGLNRTIKYMRRWFWWPDMANDIKEFCRSCRRCQMAKMPRQRPPRWLHTMPIPSRPWESIGMDFTGPFMEVGGFDYILLVICRMTGMVHLIPTQMNATARQVAKAYVREVVRLHGILESIVLDRDMKFTSQFWKELSKILGQRLLMSTSYHPQTDRSLEQAIQAMSQMLQMVINDAQMNWVEQLPLIEFAMNSAKNESTGLVPFEVNYGWMPRIIQGINFDSARPGVKQFAENIMHVIDKTFDRLLAQRTRQVIKVNCNRREGQNFQAGDLVLLSTENLNLPKGHVCKLCPKYIGPYKILEAHLERLTYKLELLPDLRIQRIHDMFHELLLKPYIGNTDNKFQKCETCVPYDIGNDPKQEWVVETIEDHKWSPKLLFKVRWALGDATWEPLCIVDKLEALDRYLELEGVSRPSDL